MQRTYRENGKVKTECFYVSALNDDNGKGGTWARFCRRKALISPPRKRCTLGRPFLRRVPVSAFVFMSLGYHRGTRGKSPGALPDCRRVGRAKAAEMLGLEMTQGADADLHARGFAPRTPRRPKYLKNRRASRSACATTRHAVRCGPIHTVR